MGSRLARFWQDWRQRHRSRLSLVLHAVGIPLVVLALVLAGWQLFQWRWDLWWRPVLLLCVGYGLQFAGHWNERNDPGEVILFKRLLGRPYVAVSPSYRGPVPKSSGGPCPRVGPLPQLDRRQQAR